MKTVINRFHWKYINSGRFLRNNVGMGQTTRSQGISFTHEMWDQIAGRCLELRCGRSKYFQMLVEADLRHRPDIHAHKGDGKWHFFPETDDRDALAAAAEPEQGAEPPGPPLPRPKRRKTR